MSPLGKTWYIPHHGVYHPKFEGRSVNQALLSGPDLINYVVGLLTCFRQEPVVFIAFVESM